jgi:hypothetical protein
VFKLDRIEHEEIAPTTDTPSPSVDHTKTYGINSAAFIFHIFGLSFVASL